MRTRIKDFAILPYAWTIAIGAFLLFQVQLVISKYLLPWFGGAPSVWTTCMVFFQVMLLVGYAYAHLVVIRLPKLRQALVHASLIAISLALLLGMAFVWNTPITPGPDWRPSFDTEPISRLLLILLASVGLPYFLLSTTTPLLQGWFHHAHPGHSPYRLYALSNVGSLLGLLTYPFLIEPTFRLSQQAWIWSTGYLLFAGGVAVCIQRLRKTTRARETLSEQTNVYRSSGDTHEESDLPTRRHYLLWTALPACASLLLLAVTNQICQESAVVPLLWVLPLGLYLLSFILCFESERWYHRGVFVVLLCVCLLASARALYFGVKVPLLIQIGVFSTTLFVCCMVCHGEVARLRPHPSRLTTYYLLISTGGALGGLSAAILAPNLFRGFWELHLGLWSCLVLLAFTLLEDKASFLFNSRRWQLLLLLATTLLFPVASWSPQLGELEKSESSIFGLPLTWTLTALLAVMCIGFWLLRSRGYSWLSQPTRWLQPLLLLPILSLSLVLGLHVSLAEGAALESMRNFYGVLRVKELDHGGKFRKIVLDHGLTGHGFQFQEPSLHMTPTAYFGVESGVGLAFQHYFQRSAKYKTAKPIRVGIIGLGVGTIAAYAREGDYFRFYEINQQVVALSQGKNPAFTFLSDSPAKIEILLGDARRTMEQELAEGVAQNYDFLIIDAFSSDAIPLHLLTREALAVYLQHLRKPNGLLAFHISNRSLNLEPVLRGLSQHYGLNSMLIDQAKTTESVWASTWYLASRSQRLTKIPELAEAASPQISAKPPIPLWTDDYSNLFKVLKR